MTQRIPFSLGEIMSDQTTQEPTMEEILASIRRIISEDDAPAAEEAAEPAAPAVVADVVPMALEEPVVAHVVADDDEDDGVLELTDRVETHGDLDVYTPVAPPEPMPAPVNSDRLF